MLRITFYFRLFFSSKFSPVMLYLQAQNTQIPNFCIRLKISFLSLNSFNFAGVQFTFNSWQLKVFVQITPQVLVFIVEAAVSVLSLTAISNFHHFVFMHSRALASELFSSLFFEYYMATYEIFFHHVSYYFILFPLFLLM